MPLTATRTSAHSIAVLPPEVANQIAAGEVVERPASVVKELVENSLDAGAEQVTVHIEAGGRRLIRVADDGIGMSAEEARLSLERHATSKLRTARDLRAISTLGFRGEALPSIASVSRLLITTRPGADLEGTALEVEGGEIASLRPTACPAGTEIQVADLFFNTPARLKFLKTESTERRYIAQGMTCQAMARPEVRFRLESDGKTLLHAAPCVDLAERATTVLGPRIAAALYPIAPGTRREEVTLTGLFGAPSTARRNTSGVYAFVNRRFVRDRRIQAAVTTAYSGLLEKGRYPVVVLYLTLPTESVDVNVHPAKTEVRFHQPDLVFRVIRGGLMEGLAAAPWVPALGRSRARVYTLRQAESAPAVGAGDPVPSSASRFPVQETLPGTGRIPSGAAISMGGWWSSADDAPTPVDAVPPDRYFSSLTYLSRLGGTYLLCQDDDGLVVIDQHAAHERVTFERLKGMYRGHHREGQALLLPVQLELDRVQLETLGEHLDFFAEMGFELELFSADSYIVRSVPAVLLGARYQQLIRDALDEIAGWGHTERFDEAVNAVLSRMACHGSVRAGDRMAPEEVRALQAQMDTIDFRANCPHGRPVFFRLSWAEIEKRFERR